MAQPSLYWLSFLVFNVLPYITAVVFLGGLIYQGVRWWQAARSPISMMVHPGTPTWYAAGRELLTEILFFRRVFVGSKVLWFVSWPFHISLLLITLGHIPMLQTWLGSLLGLTIEQAEWLPAIVESAAGIIFAVTLVLFLILRLLPPLRSISVPIDYLLLILLLLIAVSGDYMHFFMPLVEEGAGSLLGSVFIQHLMFIIHLPLVQLLLIYFPFSKLLHVTGNAFTLKWAVAG